MEAKTEREKRRVHGHRNLIEVQKLKGERQIETRERREDRRRKHRKARSENNEHPGWNGNVLSRSEAMRLRENHHTGCVGKREMTTTARNYIVVEKKMNNIRK